MEVPFRPLHSFHLPPHQFFNEIFSGGVRGRRLNKVTFQLWDLVIIRSGLVRLVLVPDLLDSITGWMGTKSLDPRWSQTAEGHGHVWEGPSMCLELQEQVFLLEERGTLKKHERYRKVWGVPILPVSTFFFWSHYSCRTSARHRPLWAWRTERGECRSTKACLGSLQDAQREARLCSVKGSLAVQWLQIRAVAL